MELKYFTFDEFDSPDREGSGKKMNHKFLVLLDEARALAGIPFKISSGYRTRRHNKKVGGVPNSSHTVGLACDIVCSSDADKYTIVNALLTVGFNRIGIAKGFIHVDADPNKNPERIWTY